MTVAARQNDTSKAVFRPCAESILVNRTSPRFPSATQSGRRSTTRIHETNTATVTASRRPDALAAPGNSFRTTVAADLQTVGLPVPPAPLQLAQGSDNAAAHAVRESGRQPYHAYHYNGRYKSCVLGV